MLLIQARSVGLNGFHRQHQEPKAPGSDNVTDGDLFIYMISIFFNHVSNMTLWTTPHQTFLGTICSTKTLKPLNIIHILLHSHMVQ